MREYDIIVVGGGHAGCEAALASARMGLDTLLLTINISTIAQMACNCSIGGPAKGHLVREIDALGGQQALATDSTYTHIRMLNTGKGPAVHALRAQVDKRLYEAFMRRTLMGQKRLDVKQGMVEELVSESASQRVGESTGRRVVGVRTQTGMEYGARCVIVTTGTFLKGLIHIGETQFPGGRAGESAAEKLSDSLRSLGFELGRLKTGTTPRIDRNTVDFSKCEVQESEPDAGPFSFVSGKTLRPFDGLRAQGDREAQGDLPCHLTYTNDRTRDVILRNLQRSAMYGGRIQGVGPRYCPSIEDKIVKFPDKRQHQVFLEQEGWDTDEVYVQGMSTSLPEEVQIEFLRTIPGLEDSRMFRPGYAIEYDFAPPTQLKPSLETKLIDGLFFAGQINGTSGYEEAAAQGLIAAINACRQLRGEEPVVIGRSQGYIGVLIDDLVTKGVTDPYRLLTSRAEYRLLLRQDNADLRLTPIGREIGLVDDRRWELFSAKRRMIENERERLASTFVRPSDRQVLGILGIELADRSCSLEEILRRPEVRYADIARAAGMLRQAQHDGDRGEEKRHSECSEESRRDGGRDGSVPPDVAEQVELAIKYSGYIERQETQVAQAAKMEEKPIPESVDYNSIRSLSREAREKLSNVRPGTLGQASRIPGITPADTAILAVHVEYLRMRAGTGRRE